MGKADRLESEVRRGGESLDVVGGVSPGGRVGGTRSDPVRPASEITVPVSLLGACGSVEGADGDEEEGDEELEDGGLLVLRGCCRRRW